MGKFVESGKPLTKFKGEEEYAFMWWDIRDLFLDRIKNHTIDEIFQYISGYFYRQNIDKYQRIKALEAMLQEVANYLDKHADIVDSPDGGPVPNKAMALAQDIDRLMDDKKVKRK